MANYTETFNGQTTGSAPSTMTSRWGTASNATVENPAIGELDSRCLRFNTGDGTGWRFFSLDSVDSDGNRANCELAGVFQVGGDDDNLAWLVGRGSGSSGSEAGYAMGFGSTGYITIGRLNSGTYTGLATVNADGPNSWASIPVDNFTYCPAGEWLRFRFRVNGTGATVTIQGKVWRDGGKEPEYWPLEFADTDASRITAAGWCGFAKYLDTQVSYLDSLAVATNGDAAALAAGTENVRITAAQAMVLQQDSATPVRITAAQAMVLQQDSATPVRVTAVQAMVLYQIIPPRPQTVVCTITQDYT